MIASVVDTLQPLFSFEYPIGEGMNESSLPFTLGPRLLVLSLPIVSVGSLSTR